MSLIDYNVNPYCSDVLLLTSSVCTSILLDYNGFNNCHVNGYPLMFQVSATSDLMLAYVDFFLGGDEKRADLPPRLHQRFPMSLVFGGEGSYMAPFSLHSDNILTSLMSQVWYL